jgi:hypothetical protein
MLSDNNISSEPVVESSSVTESAPQQDVSNNESSTIAEPVKAAKTFSQEQVNIISASTKRNVEARLRAEYEAKYNPQRSEQQYSEPQVQSQQPVYNEEQLYNNFKQRQERENQEQQTQNIANDFLAKIQSSGRAEKLESSGLGQLPVNHPLVHMLNSVDNLSDIIDDFETNPVKVANLLSITHLNPMNGLRELQNISASIRRNKEALEREKAPAPLSQLKPSSYGLGGGPQTISDKRRNSAFKF